MNSSDASDPAAANQERKTLEGVATALDRAEQLLRSEEYDPEVLLVSTPLRVIAYIRSAIDRQGPTRGGTATGSSC